MTSILWRCAVRASAAAMNLMATMTLLAGAPLGAQQRLPSDGGTTASLGQPGGWLPSIGVATGVKNTADGPAPASEGRVGVYFELFNRVLGLGGVQLEAYGGTLNTHGTGGGRVRLVSPFARTGIGIDYNAFDETVRPLISTYWTVRRGGVFRDGTMVRVDYRFGQWRSFAVGLEKPVLRRIPAGSTRPLDDRVRLPATRAPVTPLPAGRPALRETLGVARAAARRIHRLTVPWLDHKGGGGTKSDQAVLDQLLAVKALAATTSLDGETRRFHDAMESAFTMAIRSDATASGDGVPTGRAPSGGPEVAAMARTVLLDEVLLPYNRLLGQHKDKDTTRDFAILARGAFLRWLHVGSGVPRARVDSALAVFEELLHIVEEVRAHANAEWGGSRFVWLPLQLALLPEEHDTQAELDALVERAVGEVLTEGNEVSYVINEQFQYQLSRTIREARDYHVLWTHDVRGLDDRGHPDEMSYRHVLRSYLAAMTERVRAYDSTGVFPTYVIILDEWFYQARGGRLWMSLLEDPLHHQFRLPAEFRSWEDSIRLAQDRLREAVASSGLLMAQRRQYGDAWLRQLVKVHVNITNASDPSFVSWNVATAFPVPDNWMRDHRKLVLYDVTEDDLYRGEAIVTGAGVGEHYANLSWEDRSLLVRGPATLALKRAARELLLGQGIPPDRIPVELQPRPRALDHDAQVAQARAHIGRPLRAVLLQNRTGFDEKSVNVTKAILYTLMPAGSVIKIPDSLWNGTFWGSVLVGCSLRGVRVLVIAPTLANAPARAFGSMIRSRELLWRLVMAGRVLEPEIAAQGGLLKVGLFASTLSVSDVPGKLLAVRRTLTGHEWLRDLFGFPEAIYTGLEELAATLGQLPAPAAGPGDFEARPRPLLHLKANSIASREAWTIMARSDWVEMTRQFVPRRMAQLSTRQAALALEGIPAEPFIDLGDDVVQRWHDELSPEERQRVVFYTILGSANQNDRSLVSDGEAVLMLAGSPSVVAYIDLISLIGQSEWIESPEELDRLLPPRGDLATRLAHWFKYSF